MWQSVFDCHSNSRGSAICVQVLTCRERYFASGGSPPVNQNLNYT